MLLVLAYYVMLALHLFKVVEITKKKIIGTKAIVPFYYWFN